MSEEGSRNLSEQFEVMEKIGAGRLASVYRAREKTFPFRLVALKTVPCANLTVPTLTLLKKEFGILKRISHPCVVEVYDFGIDVKGGVAYVAEEFLEGEPAPHARVSQTTLIHWLEMLARSLHYLHRHHVSHGDIKPENIIILDDGGLKLVDFGFADKHASGVTLSEPLMGTFNYLAPERLSGGPSSPAADLYALGVTLYQWATGHLPFREKGIFLLLPAVLGETPLSPLKLNPHLATPLADLILALLQKNPIDRPQSGNDLLREINGGMKLNLRLEEERSSRLWWEMAESYGSSPLDPGQTEDLITSCLEVEGIKPFATRLYTLTGGKPRFVVEALTILVEKAIDPLGPFAPQLNQIIPEDHLIADPLTGIHPKPAVTLKESRYQLIEEVRHRLATHPEEVSSRRLLAQLLTQNGDFKDAFSLVAFQDEPLLTIKLLNRLGRFEEALSFAEDFKGLEKKTTEMIDCLNQKGTSLYFLGKPGEAAGCFEKAALLARGEELWEEAAVCLNNLGNVHAHGPDPMKALPLYRESLELSRKVEDPFGEGTAQANLGQAYHMVQDYLEAIKCYYAGANVFRRIGSFGEMSQIKGNLGALYLELGALARAEEAILESLQLAQDRRMDHQIYHAYLTYGDLLRRRGRIGESRSYYVRAQKGFCLLNAVEDEKEASFGLIRLSLAQGDWALATKALERVASGPLSERQRAQWNLLQAQLLFARGEKLKSVESLVQEAEALFLRLNQPDQQLLSNIFLRKLYLRFDKPDMARECRTKIEAIVAESMKRIPEEYLDAYNSLVTSQV